MTVLLIHQDVSSLSFQRALKITLEKNSWLVYRAAIAKKFFLSDVSWSFTSCFSYPLPHFLPSSLCNPFLLHFNWSIENTVLVDISLVLAVPRASRSLLEFTHPDCVWSWWGNNSWRPHSITEAEGNRSLPSLTQQSQGQVHDWSSVIKCCFLGSHCWASDVETRGKSRGVHSRLPCVLTTCLMMIAGVPSAHSSTGPSIPAHFQVWFSQLPLLCELLIVFQQLP